MKTWFGSLSTVESQVWLKSLKRKRKKIRYKKKNMNRSQNENKNILKVRYKYKDVEESFKWFQENIIL